MATPFDKIKDPTDVSDWTVTFKLASGDQIASVVSTVASPDTITIESAMIVGNSVVVWLSGGEAGTTYEIAVTINTMGGRTFERTGEVTVENQ